MRRDDLVRQARVYVSKAKRVSSFREKQRLLDFARRLMAMRVHEIDGLTLVRPLDMREACEMAERSARGPGIR